MTGVPRARKLGFFSNMARRNLIAARAGCFMGAGVAPQKARAREVGASTDDRALAPQSDHGSSARAETEAFFQYGPPHSDCGGGKLTLFSKAARPAIRSRERKRPLGFALIKRPLDLLLLKIAWPGR